MKGEPLAKRAGAYWPINSLKCCIPSSLLHPHFGKYHLKTYLDNIDFFLQITSHFPQVQYVTETEKPISKSVRKKATIGEETLNVVRCFKFFKSSEGRVYGAVITRINNIYSERKVFLVNCWTFSGCYTLMVSTGHTCPDDQALKNLQQKVHCIGILKQHLLNLLHPIISSDRGSCVYKPGLLQIQGPLDTISKIEVFHKIL